MDKKSYRSAAKDPLFREATEDVVPIKHDRVEPFRKPLRPKPLHRQPTEHSEFEDESSHSLSEAEIETGEDL